MLLEVNASSCLYVHAQFLYAIQWHCHYTSLLLMCLFTVIPQVLFSVSDRANIGFDKFEALLKALRVSKTFNSIHIPNLSTGIYSDSMKFQVDGLSPVGARVFFTYYLEQIGCQQTGVPCFI